MTDRYSTPPSAETLEASTVRLTAALDKLESKPPVVLTNSHRLACCRELWALHVSRGYVHMDQTLNEYERVARERREGRET